MPAPSRPNFVRRLLSFSRQLSSRPSRRGRMCKKTVTTTRWAARKRRRAWRGRRRSAAGVRSAGYRAKCDRGGAAGFWAISGAATKLPPKKLLQRHAGPSQRAAGQLLLWARTVLGPISRFSHPISLVSPYPGCLHLLVSYRPLAHDSWLALAWGVFSDIICRIDSYGPQTSRLDDLR